MTDLHESEEDKYQNFHTMLVKALDEPEIRKQIQGIVTKYVAMLNEPAGCAEAKDCDKNEKTKVNFKEKANTIDNLQKSKTKQAEQINELLQTNRQQAEEIQELQHRCELQLEKMQQLEEQIDDQLLQLQSKNIGLRTAQNEIACLKQSNQQLKGENEAQAEKLTVWEKEFAKPVEFYQLYKSLPKAVRGNFVNIIADTSVEVFIMNGSNIEYVEMFWDAMKQNYSKLGAEREILIQVLAYLLELCNIYQGEEVYVLLNDEIGKGFDDDMHMRSENCSKYSKTIEKILLPGIWNKRANRANRKALVEWQ